jgi:hypothetical protein
MIYHGFSKKPTKNNLFNFRLFTKKPAKTLLRKANQNSIYKKASKNSL